MNINYADSCNFKPIPAITPLDGYWQNSTWKFNMSEINAGAAYQPSWIDIILSGNTALTLVNAKADSLNYLKLSGGTEQLPETYLDSVTLSGGCEQRNLPVGYTEYDGLIGDGTAYIDLNCALDQDDEIEIMFKFSESTTGRNVFGSRASASSQNITVFFAGTENRLVIDFNNSDYSLYRLLNEVSINTIYTLKISKNSRAIYQGDTLIAENNTVCPDDISILSAYLFFANGSPAYQTKFNGTIYSCTIKGKRDMVPCGNGTTYGMYDKLNSVFYPNANTEGSFTVGAEVTTPTPDKPMDIVSNNGTIKARQQSGLPLGYTLLDCIESSGTQSIDPEVTGNARWVITAQATEIKGSSQSLISSTQSASGGTWYGEFTTTGHWDVVSGGTNIPPTTKTTADLTFDGDGVRGTIGSTSVTRSAIVTQGTWRIFGTTGDSYPFAGKLFDAKVYQDGVLVRNMIPAKNSSNEVGLYDLVGQTFFTNYGTGNFIAGNTVSDPIEIYTDGVTEQVTDSLGNTASAEMLLAVGDYKDTQEVISGSVTRNVGVKVFDGSESWSKITNQNAYYTKILGMLYCNPVQAGLSNQFIGAGVATADMPDNSIKLSYTSDDTGAILFKHNDTTTLEDWVQFVTDKYNSGNPIIAIYPLATATTESATPQLLLKPPVTQTAGSISGLTVNAVSSSHTVPTPQQPLDINCNNGVLKVSKNLFDKTTYIAGKYYNASGNIVENPNFGMTGFIPMKSGQTFALSGRTPSGIALFNTSQVWQQQVTGQTFTAPYDGYLVVSIASGEQDTLQVELGSTATPYTPYSPTGIYTDGTTETVEVHSKNLFDNELLLDATGWTKTDGVYSGNNVTLYSKYGVSTDGLPLQYKPNTQYTISYTIVSSGSVSNARFRIYYTDNTLSDGVLSGIVTTPTTYTLTSVSGKSISKIVYNYTDGIGDISLKDIQLEQGSTATTYEPYYNGGSATAERLLKVGTYQDVQSVLDGGVTRKVGIKVFDGTEDWRYTNSRFRLTISDFLIGSSIMAMIISHYKLPAIDVGSIANGEARFGKNAPADTISSDNILIIHDDNYTDVNSYKAWLDQQYANGTPVIIVYPLAESTTESVTAQPLTIQEGTNIVEITQASMDDLELEVSYKAGVTVTITEVQNAQLDNSVEVTIQ